MRRLLFEPIMTDEIAHSRVSEIVDRCLKDSPIRNCRDYQNIGEMKVINYRKVFEGIRSDRSLYDFLVNEKQVYFKEELDDFMERTFCDLMRAAGFVGTDGNISLSNVA